MGNPKSSSNEYSFLDDFKPASIDPNRTASMDIGRNGKVTLALPNVEGAQGGQTESVYQGQIKPHQKECVLIFDHETGEITLERLAQSLIVKKTRAISSNNASKLLLSSEDLNNERATSVHSNNVTKTSQPTTTASLTQPSASIKYSGASNGKAASVVNGQKLMPNIGGKRVSPPLNASKQVANGKSTPSPPSMPIFNRGALVHTEPTATTSNLAKNCTLFSASARRSITPPSKVNNAHADREHASPALLSSSSSSSDDSDADASVRFESVKKKKIGAKKASPAMCKGNNLSMPSFLALASSSSSVVKSPSPARPVGGSQMTNGNPASSSTAVMNANFKKHKSLVLSEDSDSESNDDDLQKLSTLKVNGDASKNVTANGDSTLKLNNSNQSANLSMPKFTTLSKYFINSNSNRLLIIFFA